MYIGAFLSRCLGTPSGHCNVDVHCAIGDSVLQWREPSLWNGDLGQFLDVKKCRHWAMMTWLRARALDLRTTSLLF